jgi:hypothetical protein
MAGLARQKAAPRKARGKKPIPFSWVFGGLIVVLIGGYVYLTNAEPASQPPLQYAAADVSYEKPFRAVHEMGGGPPIRFLPKDQPQPKIVLPGSFHDFGLVGARAVVERRFMIRNEGEGPLTISRAYTTCGCTTAEFTARVIPPGKIALVTLILNAGFHDVRGQVVKRGIIIESNDREKSKAEFWVRASVAQG